MQINLAHTGWPSKMNSFSGSLQKFRDIPMHSFNDWFLYITPKNVQQAVFNFCTATERDKLSELIKSDD